MRNCQNVAPGGRGPSCAPELSTEPAPSTRYAQIQAGGIVPRGGGDRELWRLSSGGAKKPKSGSHECRSRRLCSKSGDCTVPIGNPKPKLRYGFLSRGSLPMVMKNNVFGARGWLSWTVDFGSGHGLTVVGLRAASGCTVSMESA